MTRFTTLNSTTKIPCQPSPDDCNDFCMKTIPCQWLASATKQLQTYENQKDSGKLISLQAKIGDTIYAYNKYFGILCYTIEHIHITGDGIQYICAAYSNSSDDPSECLDELTITDADFNHTVFFTQETVPLP